MRATLVGHACWLFETAPMFLTIRVVRSLRGGTVTSCPRRAVRLEQFQRCRHYCVASASRSLRSAILRHSTNGAGLLS